jgi:hypothetical protein
VTAVRHLAAFAILSLGCGGGDGGTSDAPPSPPDAPDPDEPDAALADAPLADAPLPDAALPDAALPDAALPDAGPPGVGAFVVSAVDVPTSASEASALGLDLDGGEPGGDPGVDNQLGSVLAALTSFGFDPQVAVADAVAQGLTIELLHFTAAGTLDTYIGANPVPPACNGPGDPVCGHHLDGTGTFDVVAMPTGSMPQSATGTTVTGGPGTAVLPILVLGTDPLMLPLIGARFTGTVTATTVTTARLAGAIPQSAIDNELIPALQVQIAGIIAAGCTDLTNPPTCGCAGTAQQIIDLFDDNQDCAVSVAELQSNSLIQALLAPDVTIGGVDALSFGVGITGVTATFTPP